MKNKYTLLFILCICIVLGLAGCTGAQNSKEGELSPSPTSDPGKEMTKEDTDKDLKGEDSSESGEKIPETSDKRDFSKLNSIVTQSNLSEYDFTDKALEYLTFIGKNYPERSVVDEETGKADEKFGDWLIEELKSYGYGKEQISEQRFTRKANSGNMVQGRNIILTVPGTEEGQIIVGAHYDGDGVGDNGSGIALLLATAESFVNVKPQYTIQFIFFDHEEIGFLGSRNYANKMSDEDVSKTLYMINVDAILFGDFCNIYGGVTGDEYDIDSYIEHDPGVDDPICTEGYFFAADMAEKLGFKVYRPKDLDGYYVANGHGMELQEDAFFTNPWTYENPAPGNSDLTVPSPAILGVSDQVPFAEQGIPYIYFEATNWWAKGPIIEYAYTGYCETYDENVGKMGMIMNTEFDTLETMQKYFPDRAEKHFRLYSPLLSALLLVK